MNKGILFNFFLLFVIFFSLYNEYILTKKCKYYFRKEDLVIEYLKASEVFNTCNSISKDNCVLEKKFYTKTMLEMDKAINK
mgnify:CR=1 FL=1|tara:strand:- start:307 stop:549 length:243 start_codon:yes stop_codon:yes gene_type:complete